MLFTLELLLFMAGAEAGLCFFGAQAVIPIFEKAGEGRSRYQHYSAVRRDLFNTRVSPYAPDPNPENRDQPRRSTAVARSDLPKSTSNRTAIPLSGLSLLCEGHSEGVSDVQIWQETL